MSDKLSEIVAEYRNQIANECKAPRIGSAKVGRDRRAHTVTGANHHNCISKAS